MRASLLLAAAIASFCGPSNSGAQQANHSLEGQAWLVSSFDTPYDSLSREDIEAYVHTEQNLTFANGRISGDTGCGPISGHYQIEGDKTEITAAWTPVPYLCSSAQERRLDFLIQDLNRSVAVEQSTPNAFIQLELVDNFGKSLIRLSRQRLGVGQSHTSEAIANASIGRRDNGIEFQRWRVTAYRDPSGLIASPAHFWATPEFVHGEVGGSSGCGALVGTYAKTGERYEFDVGWVLGGWCPGEHGKRSSCLSAAFNRSVTAKIVGLRVELLNQEGLPEVILEPWPGTRGLPDPPLQMEVENTLDC